MCYYVIFCFAFADVPVLICSSMDKLSRPMKRSDCFAMGHLVLFCYRLLVKWLLVVIWVTC